MSLIEERVGQLNGDSASVSLFCVRQLHGHSVVRTGSCIACGGRLGELDVFASPSKMFSQTFPAMLLRLVGSADTAGVCEKEL